jgi:hypothetical protein
MTPTPIYPLFRHLPFDPEHLDMMSSAFEQVSLELGLAMRTDKLRDIVAEAIIQCAQRGIRDPAEIRRCAREALQMT